MSFLRNIAVGALSAGLAAGGAVACEVVHVYNYSMQDGAYEMTLNGVHVAGDAEPGDYFGGGPFFQWLAEGENTLTITMTSGAAEIDVQRACRGAFEGEVLVAASLTAPETRELTFFVEDAPKAVYADLAPLSDDGLAEAVAKLTRAVKNRNAKVFWRMHKAMRMEAEAQGFPVAQMRAYLDEVVAGGEAEFEDDLVFKPVMGGRVWQVMTADHKPPVTLRQKFDGGSTSFGTGAFWTQVDGKWRVLGDN